MVRIEENYADQIFNSSEKRLARILLMLADSAKDGKDKTAISGMIQDNLAQMVGTTRSRINYFMNKFRKQGFIHYNGGLTVHRDLLLAVLHD
ncbi:MAG: helix-turn-helix domain-containing protein [Terriglobia bacterium]